MIQEIIKSYFSTWLNIFNFWGRATRQDTIVFGLGTFFLMILFALVSFYSHTYLNFNIYNPNAPVSLRLFGHTLFSYRISDVYESILLICLLTLGIRRLHDTGQSGLGLLYYLIPVIGQLYLFLTIFCAPSNYHSQERHEDNPYSKAPYQTKI